MSFTRKQDDASPGSRNCCNHLLAVVLVCLLSTDSQTSAQDKAQIDWQEGPRTVNLGNVAQIKIPVGFRFTGAEGTRLFGEQCHNPPDGTEIGILMPSIAHDGNTNNLWFILFRFDAIGYVRDDDKTSLDAVTKAAILSSLRQGAERDNEIRKQKGWTPLLVEGWDREPFYDDQSHNLTWALRSKGGTELSTNYNANILCRTGVLRAVMVLDPQFLASSLPAYNSLIGGISLNNDNQYGSFREGDKVAEYGLVALIAGGVGTAVVKTGVFVKYMKPLLVVLFVAIAALFRKIKEIGSKIVLGNARGTDPTAGHGPVEESSQQSAQNGGTTKKQPETTAAGHGPLWQQSGQNSGTTTNRPGEGGPFVIASCPHCRQKNRIPTSRLAEHPVCGRCHNPVIIPESAP
jgi:uncharacterized membrane-anchored protein